MTRLGEALECQHKLLLCLTRSFAGGAHAFRGSGDAFLARVG
jgi:hypothetical protein